MRRLSLSAVLAATLLLLPRLAAAELKQADLEPAKQLTLVELYLRGVRDGARALQLVGQVGETASDPTVIDEITTRTLDEVTRSETHVRQLRKLGVDTSRLDRHVRKLREAANRLAAFHPGAAALSPRELRELQIAAEHITAHASDALRRAEGMAGAMGHATLDQVDVRERVPVRGQ